jgi:chromatin remodeling complex protein RSC6
MAKPTKTESAPAQTKTETAPAQTKTEKAPKTPKAPKSAAAAPASAPVEAAAPELPAKSSKKKTAAAVAAPVPVAAEAPVAASADAAVAEVSNVSSEFGGFMVKLQQLGALISTLKTEFRSLEKKASRELKTAAKASSKRKRKTGNRSPSGFVKPTLISDELASFLGKTKGTEMARTEVTREINAYIRANQLQDKTNGRRINADSKLSSLLKLTSGEELTYFNLQRYMSPHFAKSGAAPVASA